MKRILFVLPLLLFLTFTSASSAFAQRVTPAPRSIPHSFLCNGESTNNPCFDWNEWDGVQLGGAATTTVKNYPLNSTSSTTAALNLGADTTSDVNVSVGVSGYGCHGAGPLAYFYQVNDYYNSQTLQSGCWNVPAGDIGNTVDLQVNYYTSNGGGVQIYINHTATGDAPCNPCGYANNRTNNKWFSIVLTAVTDGAVPPNNWSIENWTKNKFMCPSGCIVGQWYYQNRLSDVFNHFNDEHMYWITDPPHSTTGGALAMCSNNNGGNGC